MTAAADNVGTTASTVFLLGPKGRVVIPVAVRRAAGLEEGAQVVAHAEGTGRIVVETPDAIRDRIWDAAPEATGLDATADIRAMREEDNRVSDAIANARSQAGDSGSGARGAALLEHLGL